MKRLNRKADGVKVPEVVELFRHLFIHSTDISQFPFCASQQNVGDITMTELNVDSNITGF